MKNFSRMFIDLAAGVLISGLIIEIITLIVTDKKVYYIPYTKYEDLAKNDGSIVKEGTSIPADTNGASCTQFTTDAYSHP